MTYRLLTVEEWSLLTELCLKEFGHPPPHPAEAAFVVGEEEGRIVTCLGIQSLPLLEGYWLKQDLRGTPAGAASLRSMLSLLAKSFPHVSSIYVKDTSLPVVQRIAQFFGMKKDCVLLKGGTNGRHGI